MPKDDLVYVGHMLDKAREALELASGKSRADYDREKALRLALTFLIQVIGEAARHVAPGFRQLHREVPWDAIMGMRHKIMHDYLDVDEDIVWDTVTEELSPLIAALKKLVPWESGLSRSDRSPLPPVIEKRLLARFPSTARRRVAQLKTKPDAASG